MYLLLPIINYFSFTSNPIIFRNYIIKLSILLFFFLVLVSEFFFKIIFFDQSFIGGLNSIKVGLPLVSSLIMLFHGFKPNLDKVFRVILLAIIGSFSISIISIFLPLPIYNDIEVTGSILEMFEGRLFNSNASFGIIAPFLLYKRRLIGMGKSRLLTIACISSILSMLLTFTRTYFLILFIVIFVIYFKKFTIKKFKFLLRISAIVCLVFFLLYSNFESIQFQIDKRFLSALYSYTEVYNQTIDNNRDVIYQGVIEKIYQGYWIIGLPYHLPIFIASKNYLRDEILFYKTDTSIFNILLRFGIFPLLLLVLIFLKMINYRFYIFNMTFLLLFLASFNIDTLFSHNAIFFSILTFFISYNNKS
jgi:hypothetical protein